MFTGGTRSRLQETLLERARHDTRIVAAALVGSTASGRQDAWSDIDIALRMGPDVDRDAVVADWTELMRREHAAVDHLDVVRAVSVRPTGPRSTSRRL